MDVRLSAEQVALRESAARLLDTLGPKNVADLDDAERATKLDAAVAAAGWREIRGSDGAGQPIASGVEAVLVAEELGRAAADTAYLGPILASDLCRRAEVAEIPTGATVALSPDLAELATVAAAPATGTAVTAPAATVIDARGSEAAVALVPADGGHTLSALEVAPPAVRVDLTRAVAAAAASASKPLASARLLADDDLAAWTAFALAVTCGDLVGTMRGATTLACEHATVREQYGRPIGSFQAVQHLLADAHVAAEGAYSLTLHAAWAVDALPPEQALLAAREAKAYCSRAARTVCETAIQVHGGIGNAWECMAHVYLRRALHSSDILGGVGPGLSHVLAQHGIEE